jgi:hypothetical protein
VQEGNYTNIYTGEPLSDFRPFGAGEPNGAKIENCIDVNKKYNNWNDLSCSFQSSTFCHVKARPNFIMRGEITLK